MVLDYIADNIVGLYPIETKPKVFLPHNTTKKDESYSAPTIPTIVAFGDASINSSMKGHPSIPLKAQQRAIAKKALVIRVDEYNTSKCCSNCYKNFHDIFEPKAEGLLFFFRKRRKKITPGIKRKIACIDDEYSIIYKASDCTEKNYLIVKLIYLLKFCNECSADNNIICNRDFNAAINIREILFKYIESGCDIKSRPLALSRARRPKNWVLSTSSK
ncbi:unnamed protein product [Rhizopus stolonifer]